MSGTPPGARTVRYLLGHDARELRRLDLQGRLYRDVTVRALRDGGLREGMRVLDLGCGSGDVSFTAAGIVGASGHVVGVDRSPEGVAFARERAAALGVDNVRFEVGAIEELEHAEPFDALVGRFVLMHQADPAAALRAAARWIRPGGAVVMVETYIALLRHGLHSEPFSPLYDQVVRWKTEVVGGAGVDLVAGARLRRTLLDAGLVEPVARLEAPLEGGPDSPYYEYLAESMHSMLAEAERLGIEGFTTEDAERLAGRLREEVVEAGGVLVVWPVVVAWARAP